MINHARNLLSNLPPAIGGLSGHPGGEYMPPTFSPVDPLPGYLQQVRRTLFGQAPDAAFINYRLAQYMSLLHATELQQFVFDLDPRITYSPGSSDLYADPRFGISISPATGTYLFGELAAPDGSGRSRQQWEATIVDSSHVRIKRLVFPLYDEVVAAQTPASLPDLNFPVNYVVDDLGNQLIADTSAWIVSGANVLYVKLPGSMAAVLLEATPGVVYSISGYARPSRSLHEIASDVSNSSRAALNDLFGVGTSVAATEPFKTFRNLWFDHPELAYQLGGLLLAVIYRTDEARQRNG